MNDHLQILFGLTLGVLTGNVLTYIIIRRWFR